MNTSSTLKTPGILYSVDPERLSIKVCNIARVNNEHCTTRTYENFSLNEDLKQSDIPSAEQLPVSINGVFYFRTEDEALNFLKAQIGL